MANSSDTSGKFNIQRLATGVGALSVVFITVLVAIFLAGKDLQPANQISPTAIPPTGSAIQIFAPQQRTSTPAGNVAATPFLAEATATTVNAVATDTPPIPTGTLIPTSTATNIPLSPGQAQPPRPYPQPPACGAPAGWVVYQVQVNDTLQSLAMRTNTSIYQLKRANCLVDEWLYAGQRLYLPFIPAPLPTATPILFTATPIPPTATPIPPTATMIPPTETPIPPNTPTATPVPPDTPTPVPPDTPTPIPPDTPTPEPPPTATPIQWIETPVPQPTATLSLELPEETPPASN